MSNAIAPGKIYSGKKSWIYLRQLLKAGKWGPAFIVCDSNTMQHCLPVLISNVPALASARIIEVEPGESSKNLQIAAGIWETLMEAQAGKSSLIINLGGGMVSDLGGFCASIYKRGVPFINIPTSLLAMADAGIGGKTAIDFQNIKNLIGTITQPAGVFIIPDLLHTLPQRHIRNGLAEIFKIALSSDGRFWDLLKKTAFEKQAEYIISQAVRLKSAIVKKDPIDAGPRKILNLGHSIAHGLEAACLERGIDLLHGEAVWAGLVMETHIAWQKKLLSAKVMKEINETCLSHFRFTELIRLSNDDILSYIRQDKKNSAAKLMFVLPDTIGSARYDQPVAEQQVIRALDYYRQQLS